VVGLYPKPYKPPLTGRRSILTSDCPAATPVIVAILAEVDGDAVLKEIIVLLAATA
jgi:hypothetical protein